MIKKHRSFKLDKFVSAVDNGLLKTFFTNQGLTIPADTVLDGNSVEKLLNDDIEEELHCINDVAEYSRDYLQYSLQDAIIGFDIGAKENDSPETTAMRIFLYSEEAFSPAYDHCLYVLHSDRLSHHHFTEGKYNSVKITDFKKK